MKRTTPPSGSSAPNQRQLRVGELIRHALAEILTRGDVHDPALEATVVTVPEVRMTPDLKLATAFVMPLGGKDADTVVAALERQQVIDGSWRGDGVVDLARFASGRLAALGLDPARVRVLPGCTACSQRYHSFRCDGNPAGRQWNAVVLTEGLRPPTP